MATGLNFLDTNVLLYRADARDSRKRQIATELCRTLEFGISTQVLQEFYLSATHPKKLGLSHSEARQILHALFEFPIHVVDLATIEEAWRLQARYQISYWDAAIVASAKALDCRTLYSEDLNDGQRYEGIRVVNPF
jgi:predicted nucleic acid-binding protein